MTRPVPQRLAVPAAPPSSRPEAAADGPAAVASRRQLGLLWGGAAVGILLLAPFASRIAPLLPACPLKSLSGIPCPGCGTTRAALALGRFDPLAAFAVSPLAAAGWCLLVWGGLVAGALAFAGHDWPRPLRAAESGGWSLGTRLAVGILLVANWLYLVLTGA